MKDYEDMTFDEVISEYESIMGKKQTDAQTRLFKAFHKVLKMGGVAYEYGSGKTEKA